MNRGASTAPSRCSCSSAPRSRPRRPRRTLFAEGEYRHELRSAFKCSLLLAIPYEADPVLFPDVPAGAGHCRLRFDLSANISHRRRRALGAVGDAEVHGELAMFGTDGRGIDGGLFSTRAVVAKVLLGGSYMVDIGGGLRISAEYHYSGFGVENIGDRPGILFDEAFQLRFARGDSQLLGRHAIAVSMSYDVQDDLSATVASIQSPVDGSGMVAPTFTWNHSDNITILLNVFVPWGTLPEAGVPTSARGASPLTIFLQARIYD